MSSSISTLKSVLHQLRSSPPSSPEKTTALLSTGKRSLLTLNALLPTPQTPPHLLYLARDLLETGALLSISLHQTDAFTRYYQQLLPFYELPPSAFSKQQQQQHQHHKDDVDGHDDDVKSQRSKITGLYLLLLLTQGDYAGFHTVLEGLALEMEGGIGGEDKYVQYPIKLERWLMEGSYDRVWAATKKEGVPSQEFAVFSEVLIDTIRREIASCSEKAYAYLPISNAKNLLFLDSEGAVLDFAHERGWVVKDMRIYFPLQQQGGEDGVGGAAAEKDVLVASGQVIENTIGYARELETIV